MYKILLEFTKIIFLCLIAKYFIDSLGISCYVPQSHSPPKPSISSPHPCSILSKKNPLPKINSKPIKTKIHLNFLSSQPLHSSQWHWMLHCVMQYSLLSKYPQIQNVHCNMSLTWFKISGTPSSLDACQNSSQIPCCCPKSWESYGYHSMRLGPSHTLAGQIWGRCQGGSTQCPGYRSGWQLS